MGDKARETALNILYNVEEKGSYPNILLKNMLDNQYSIKDKGLITELVYGTISYKINLDYIISLYSSVKLKKLSKWVLCILRLGIYQIMYLDRIPDSAACNTSVELAKKYNKKSSGFVNAVLRNVIRSKEAITYPDKNQEIKYLSVRYSFSEWMIKSFIEQYGRDFTEKLLSSLNERPDLSIRINTLKTDKESLKAMLKDKVDNITDGKFMDNAVIIDGVSSIMHMKEYRDGLFTVQDESSMLVSQVLAPKEGETVLDICAGPGGKSTHIAELMGNKGTILALDVFEHKLKLIDDSAKRMGMSIVETKLNDATILNDNYINKFDKVLVDAPCSGTGIIRRKPDIKWQKNEKDFDEIVELQRKILYNSLEYIKTNGELVYSTCSIDKRENEDIIKEMLSKHKNIKPLSILEPLPKKVRKKTADEGYLNLYPNVDKTDGFFISKFVKVNSDH